MPKALTFVCCVSMQDDCGIAVFRWVAAWREGRVEVRSDEKCEVQNMKCAESSTDASEHLILSGLVTLPL